MDRASQALMRGLPDGGPKSLRAIADYSGVPPSTPYYRKHGRRSNKLKAQSQQYLAPFEERAIVEFILQIAELGTPVRVKYIPCSYDAGLSSPTERRTRHSKYLLHNSLGVPLEETPKRVKMVRNDLMLDPEGV